jgi:antitoxin component YwqK of YwqJK toxin-antitoxin module
MAHGVWRTFYQADTTTAELTTYKNGKMNGPWKQFFKTGKIKCTGFYFNDNLDGEYIGLNTEGGILYKGQYVEGLREGLWEYFTDQGKLKTKEWYKTGEMVKEEILIKDEPIKDEALDPSLDPEKAAEQGEGIGR